MKKIYTAFLLFIVMTVCGCTQNNGHIGPIFGSWALMEITADGEPLELINETVFSFQNEVVQVIRIDDAQFDKEIKYGNFKVSDETLSLTFLTQMTPDGEGYGFLMPSWLYFPKGHMPLMFDIDELNGKRMKLSIENQGKIFTYRFERTW